jgi:hypothetical protein
MSLASRPSYSIRFPLIKERTRFGRRVSIRLVADKTGLQGARFCAAGMITMALSYRAEAARVIPVQQDIHRRISRLGMRSCALWARVFAGQIDQHDPRIDAAQNERSVLVQQLLGRHAA